MLIVTWCHVTWSSLGLITWHDIRSHVSRHIPSASKRIPRWHHCDATHPLSGASNKYPLMPRRLVRFKLSFNCGLMRYKFENLGRVGLPYPSQFSVVFPPVSLTRLTSLSSFTRHLKPSYHHSFHKVCFIQRSNGTDQPYIRVKFWSKLGSHPTSEYSGVFPLLHNSFFCLLQVGCFASSTQI